MVDELSVRADAVVLLVREFSASGGRLRREVGGKLRPVDGDPVLRRRLAEHARAVHAIFDVEEIVGAVFEAEFDRCWSERGGAA